MSPRKVLILTVDCWNSNISAGSSQTYSTLFSSMDDVELSNIYIREELPNDPCCKRYFQISESKIIKSIFKRNMQTGREVSAELECNREDIDRINDQHRLYSKQRKHLYYTKKLVRELLWLVAPWKSEELKAYLKDIDPEIIIYSMEGYIHFNRICRYAKKVTGARSIGYFWDDNFTYKQRKKLGYKIYRFFQRKSLKKLAAETDEFWAISPKTKAEADKFFNISSTVIPKPTERDLASAPENKRAVLPIKMLYAGNLMIGRMDTVRMLAEVIKEINSDEEKIVLDVYTPTEVPESMKEANSGVNFHDPVSQTEVLRLQESADVLLFAEDIVGKERKVARLSFSTKIPDYLSCGKCILAIGDFDTAPMEYFINEDVAICADTKEKIREGLMKLICEPDSITEYGKKAYACAVKNHSKEKIKNKIMRDIEKLRR